MITEDEAREQDWLEQLDKEHSEEAIREFTADRLKSMYLAEPLLAESAQTVLAEAAALHAAGHFAAASVFGASAAEIALKLVFLRPLVSGLVHDKAAASLITDVVLMHTCMDRFKDLLLRVLDQQAGVRLDQYCRPGTDTALWQELMAVRQKRNKVLHSGVAVTEADAMAALTVARALLQDVFPRVIENLGMHLHDGVRICEDWHCKDRRSPRRDRFDRNGQPSSSRSAARGATWPTAKHGAGQPEFPACCDPGVIPTFNG